MVTEPLSRGPFLMTKATIDMFDSNNNRGDDERITLFVWCRLLTFGFPLFSFNFSIILIDELKVLPGAHAITSEVTRGPESSERR